MNALQTFIAKLPFGFITSAQLPELIALDRLHPCLIRCGGCRVTTAAQDVEHVIRCISAGGDYVRDVSLPVGSMERAAKWQSVCPSQGHPHGAVYSSHDGQAIMRNGKQAGVITPSGMAHLNTAEIEHLSRQRRDKPQAGITKGADCRREEDSQKARSFNASNYDDTISESNTGL